MQACSPSRLQAGLLWPSTTPLCTSVGATVEDQPDLGTPGCASSDQKAYKRHDTPGSCTNCRIMLPSHPQHYATNPIQLQLMVQAGEHTVFTWQLCSAFSCMFASINAISGIALQGFGILASKAYCSRRAAMHFITHNPTHQIQPQQSLHSLASCLAVYVAHVD